MNNWQQELIHSVFWSIRDQKKTLPRAIIKKNWQVPDCVVTMVMMLKYWQKHVSLRATVMFCHFVLTDTEMRPFVLPGRSVKWRLLMSVLSEGSDRSWWCIYVSEWISEIERQTEGKKDRQADIHTYRHRHLTYWMESWQSIEGWQYELYNGYKTIHTDIRKRNGQNGKMFQ